MSSFSAGEESQPPLLVAGQWVAPSVCFEDIFNAEVRDFFPQATLMVNGSNNAWYGDSLAPHQHLQIARMRTLETGRPLLRATTNGISVIVDHRGRIQAASPQFVTFVLEGSVQPMEGVTPFIQWGNLPILLFALLLLGVGLVWRRPDYR
jgi:apolipoprotein N-acyltransferase